MNVCWTFGVTCTILFITIGDWPCCSPTGGTAPEIVHAPSIRTIINGVPPEAVLHGILNSMSIRPLFTGVKVTSASVLSVV